MTGTWEYPFGVPDLICGPFWKIIYDSLSGHYEINRILCASTESVLEWGL